MSADTWIVWGMLGCLWLGYGLGWWARRREVEYWHRRARWAHLLEPALGGIVDAFPPQEENMSQDSVAVERLLREL